MHTQKTTSIFVWIVVVVEFRALINQNIVRPSCIYFVWFLFCFRLFTFYVFRFEIPGVPQGIRLSHEFPNKNAEFKYFGRGLNEGECGVSIEQVKPAYNGKVKCILGLTEDEVSGEVDLTVACKYTRRSLTHSKIVSEMLDGIHVVPFRQSFFQFEYLISTLILPLRQLFVIFFFVQIFRAKTVFSIDRMIKFTSISKREQNKWTRKKTVSVTVSIFFFSA